ncbi:kinase-like domain-containing protein [Lipomyces chichibuensis]|uniref:kinase-like domain-containing protein n=1 Tax=Lipomyces chichibuensis TaxID=1546026 RepID=UPI00334411D2
MTHLSSVMMFTASFSGLFMARQRTSNLQRCVCRGYATLTKQILLGLDFLHKRGIFIVPPEFCPVNWLQGFDVNDSAPKYRITSQRPRGMLNVADSSTFLVKIGDMGGAIWTGQRDQQPVTPTGLRAPELIYGGSWDASIDIWTLGCLLFELATNEPLFAVETFGLKRDEIDEIHEKLLHHIDNDNCFTAYLSERLPSDFGNENTRQFALFLLSMLRRLPQERKTTTELLTHGFLQSH